MTTEAEADDVAGPAHRACLEGREQRCNASRANHRAIRKATAAHGNPQACNTASIDTRRSRRRQESRPERVNQNNAMCQQRLRPAIEACSRVRLGCGSFGVRHGRSPQCSRPVVARHALACNRKTGRNARWQAQLGLLPSPRNQRFCGVDARDAEGQSRSTCLRQALHTARQAPCFWLRAAMAAFAEYCSSDDDSGSSGDEAASVSGRALLAPEVCSLAPERPSDAIAPHLAGSRMAGVCRLVGRRASIAQGRAWRDRGGKKTPGNLHLLAPHARWRSLPQKPRAALTTASSVAVGSGQRMRLACAVPAVAARPRHNVSRRFNICCLPHRSPAPLAP